MKSKWGLEETKTEKSLAHEVFIIPLSLIFIMYGYYVDLNITY